jgi:hypothetical protein
LLAKPRLKIGLQMIFGLRGHVSKSRKVMKAIMDPFHKFGSTWFCLQMRDALQEQRRVLERLLPIQGDSVHKLKPSILGLLSVSDALARLWPDRLLNESHVLMRVLVERSVTLCCLTVGTPAELQELFRYDSAPPERTKSESPDSVEAVMAHAKAFANFGEELLSRTGRKLALLESKSKVNVNVFRLSMAMHYPIALAALSGSPQGSVCHIRPGFAEKQDSYFQEEFSALFMEANSLIYEAIKAVGAVADIKSIVAESEKADLKAVTLMQRIKEPVAPDVADADGWWAVLPELEHTAKSRIQGTLDAFEPAFRLCADLGVQVPALPTDKPRTESAKLSALFLKRVLNDLRGVWVLLNTGYPSQAASIAASLFENAAIIQCIAGNEARAAKVSKNPFDKLPWDNAQMCKFISVDEAKRGEVTAVNTEAWKYLYGQYCWLCEIKHPTLHQTIYDAGATARSDSSYAVMTYPDIRQDNVGTKRQICYIVITATEAALRAFARATDAKRDSAGYLAFESRVQEINKIIVAELKSSKRYHGFGILDTAWARKNIQQTRPQKAGSSHKSK